MIKSSNFRLFFSILVLFILTSSCEDKKHNDFGSVSLQFDYKKEVTTSNNHTNLNLSDDKVFKLPIKDYPFDKGINIEKESSLYKDTVQVFSIESPTLDSEDSIEDNKNSDNQSSGVSAARISIGSNVPVTIDFNTQTSYSRSDLPIGSTVIIVALLDDISNNITLYQQSKNVDIIKNVVTSVIFNDFTPVNQAITLTNNFQSEYTVGDNINLTWTNTHSELPVSIRLIQENESTIVKTIQSNYTGNTFSWEY